VEVDTPNRQGPVVGGKPQYYAVIRYPDRRRWRERPLGRGWKSEAMVPSPITPAHEQMTCGQCRSTVSSRRGP